MLDAPKPAAPELQRTVDDLAERLGAPVLVEDQHMVPLAYSSHGGELDHVRVASILSRRPDPAAKDAMLAQGIHTARGPVRTDPIPELGLKPRVCVPLHVDDQLLGYLWVLDLGIDEEALDHLRDAAEVLADMLAMQDEEGWRTRALQALIGSDVEAAAAAARALAARGLALGGARVLVAGTSRQADDTDAWLAAGVTALRSTMGAGRWLSGKLGRQQVLVVLPSDGDDARAAQRLALRLHAVLDELAARPQDVRAYVALGPVFATPEAARRSLRCAQKALLVARGGALGDVVDWAELGPLQLLSHLDPSTADDMVLRLAELRLAEPVLHATLERYLDLAGDAQATALALGIHRGTLYHRLRRVEELTSTSLADGLDRLWLHAALKARLVLPAA